MLSRAPQLAADGAAPNPEAVRSRARIADPIRTGSGAFRTDLPAMFIIVQWILAIGRVSVTLLRPVG